MAQTDATRSGHHRPTERHSRPTARGGPTATPLARLGPGAQPSRRLEAVPQAVLHPAENLTAEEHLKLTNLLAGPVGGELRVARMFLEEWFAIWHDDLGHRRTAAEAELHYQIWHNDAEAAKITPLRRQQQHLDIDHFRRLSAFLHDSAWESTNNAA